MTETITGLLILSGSGFAVIGALGLLRMPDVLIRMHASTKIGTLACGLIMVSCAVYFGTSEIIIRAIAVILFLLLTAPIGAHMIGRSVISTGVALWNTNGVAKDDLDENLPLKNVDT
ncbi:monovalent cation/H(+) antiporter subunit G [Marivita sp. S0852]|uniref:monovalent cation/H(+) antiporter subunit G n=1 Tax=Marivita sp. S0852 TaxID=3373893 RepID=UPI003982BF13